MIWETIQFLTQHFCHFSFAQVIQIHLDHLCATILVIQVYLDQLSTTAVRCSCVHKWSKYTWISCVLNELFWAEFIFWKEAATELLVVYILRLCMADDNCELKRTEFKLSIRFRCQYVRVTSRWITCALYTRVHPHS